MYHYGVFVLFLLRQINVESVVRLIVPSVVDIAELLRVMHILCRKLLSAEAEATRHLCFYTQGEECKRDNYGYFFHEIVILFLLFRIMMLAGAQMLAPTNTNIRHLISVST